MSSLVRILERQQLRGLVVICLGLLVLVGAIDYITGYEMFFTVFYLLEVGLAAWLVGRPFGFVMSFLSVVVWAGGDLAAGVHYSRPWIILWNSVILMVFYFVVVWLITNLRTVYRSLESRVAQRTEALTLEIAQRKRLEDELLKVSEREQRRIGNELHDGLCQHLTATALAGQVLQEELARQTLPESSKAARVVAMVEEGINLARNVARGLYPVEMDAEGLMAAFHDMAEMVSKTGRVACVFECHDPVLIHDDSVATQFYRIGQEAVRNAIQHAKPRRIMISLSEPHHELRLTVEDDGSGIPEKLQETPGAGLGLRIMAHRAALIGGSLSIEPSPTGGTIVMCLVPAPAKTTSRHAN